MTRPAHAPRPGHASCVPKLLIATGNRHKVVEIAEILARVLAGMEIQLLNATDDPALSEPEETGATFAENAELKARHYARGAAILALADDSGLVVDALGGRPGIHSARYGATSQESIDRLLDEMKDVEPGGRTARFVCVAALADPEGRVARAEGTLAGRLLTRPRGEWGFGYDPIFEPLLENSPAGRTLAEFRAEEKNRVSHRARALLALAPRLLASLAAGRVKEPLKS